MHKERKRRKTAKFGRRDDSKMCFQENQMEMLYGQRDVSSHAGKGIPTTLVHFPTDENSKAVLFIDCEFSP